MLFRSTCMVLQSFKSTPLLRRLVQPSRYRDPIKIKLLRMLIPPRKFHVHAAEMVCYYYLIKRLTIPFCGAESKYRCYCNHVFSSPCHRAKSETCTTRCHRLWVVEVERETLHSNDNTIGYTYAYSAVYSKLCLCLLYSSSR